MKFNLTLDESLFDDEFELDSGLATKSSDLDDDFSEFEDHSTTNVPPSPRTTADSGASATLVSLINDEWEAIQGYHDAIQMLKSMEQSNPFYSKAIKVLEEISAEENVHVGQLQELLTHVSPNASEIHEGEKEAKSQLGLVGGVLPVQSWDTESTAPVDSTPTDNNELCTLCDIDDEM